MCTLSQTTSVPVFWMGADYVAAARKRSHQWCVSLTPNNPIIRRDLPSSSYNTQPSPPPHRGWPLEEANIPCLPSIMSLKNPDRKLRLWSRSSSRNKEKNQRVALLSLLFLLPAYFLPCSGSLGEW